MVGNVWKVLFYIYRVFVVHFIVLTSNADPPHALHTIQSNMERRSQGESFANLVPFRTIETYVSDLSFTVAFMNVFGNIVPFIPMGFLLPMAFPAQRNIIKTMISCFLLILTVEILQLVLFLGSFDVDDIILNLLSCFIGYILFQVYKNIFRVVPQR